MGAVEDGRNSNGNNGALVGKTAMDTMEEGVGGRKGWGQKKCEQWGGGNVNNGVMGVTEG